MTNAMGWVGVPRHAHYGGFDAEKRVQKFTRDRKISKRESRSSSKSLQCTTRFPTSKSNPENYMLVIFICSFRAIIQLPSKRESRSSSKLSEKPSYALIPLDSLLSTKTPIVGMSGPCKASIEIPDPLRGESVSDGNISFN